VQQEQATCAVDPRRARGIVEFDIEQVLVWHVRDHVDPLLGVEEGRLRDRPEALRELHREQAANEGVRRELRVVLRPVVVAHADVHLRADVLPGHLVGHARREQPVPRHAVEAEDREHRHREGVEEVPVDDDVFVGVLEQDPLEALEQVLLQLLGRGRRRAARALDA
jgi:hypothetical protein